MAANFSSNVSADWSAQSERDGCSYFIHRWLFSVIRPAGGRLLAGAREASGGVPASAGLSDNRVVKVSVLLELHRRQRELRSPATTEGGPCCDANNESVRKSEQSDSITAGVHVFGDRCRESSVIRLLFK